MRHPKPLTQIRIAPTAQDEAMGARFTLVRPSRDLHWVGVVTLALLGIFAAVEAVKANETNT